LGERLVTLWELKEQRHGNGIDCACFYKLISIAEEAVKAARAEQRLLPTR
jgi:hypothetical protein